MNISQNRLAAALVLLFGSFGWFSGHAQSLLVTTSGDVVRGTVVYISSTEVGVRTDTGLVKIPRSNLSSTDLDLPAEKADSDAGDQPQITGPEPQDKGNLVISPLSRRLLVEFDSELGFVNPFGLRFGNGLWYRANNNWHVGPTVSFHFFRYAMVSTGVGVRRFFGNKTWVRVFMEANVRASIYEQQTSMQAVFWYPYRFSTVWMADLGPGIWMDSGLGSVITFRGRLQFYDFTLEQWPNDSFYSRDKYSALTICLSGSLIF